MQYFFFVRFLVAGYYLGRSDTTTCPARGGRALSPSEGKGRASGKKKKEYEASEGRKQLRTKRNDDDDNGTQYYDDVSLPSLPVSWLVCSLLFAYSCITKQAGQGQEQVHTTYRSIRPGQGGQAGRVVHGGKSEANATSRSTTWTWKWRPFIPALPVSPSPPSPLANFFVPGREPTPPTPSRQPPAPAVWALLMKGSATEEPQPGSLGWWEVGRGKPSTALTQSRSSAEREVTVNGEQCSLYLTSCDVRNTEYCRTEKKRNEEGGPCSERRSGGRSGDERQMADGFRSCRKGGSGKRSLAGCCGSPVIDEAGDDESCDTTTNANKHSYGETNTERQTGPIDILTCMYYYA